MGRLVKTHSTYVEGLIPILEFLAKDEHIHTLTPGVIKKSRSHLGKFQLKITRSISYGFKLVARKGCSTQEVYIITSYSRDSLEEIIAKYN